VSAFSRNKYATPITFLSVYRGLAGPQTLFFLPHSGHQKSVFSTFVFKDNLPSRNNALIADFFNTQYVVPRLPALDFDGTIDPTI
jgi:hypothetical protein